MSAKTRLDVVVRLRERDEDKARRELAEAQRRALAAEQALRDAEAQARRDERARGRAMDWELVEAAHTRALAAARQAEHAAHAASEHVGSTRVRFLGAHARAEAMRRVVEARRWEMVREAEMAERKILDEVATLLYVRG